MNISCGFYVIPRIVLPVLCAVTPSECEPYPFHRICFVYVKKHLFSTSANNQKIKQIAWTEAYVVHIASFSFARKNTTKVISLLA